MKKHITDEKTGISYSLLGDYYIPNLAMPATDDYQIGRFGRERAWYLKNHRKVLHTQLLMQGKMNSHLHEIDVQAKDMYDRLVKQCAKAQGVTEELKAEDQMEWVGRMNNIQNAAEEAVLKELIYT